MRNEVEGVARISRVLAITCLQIKVPGGKSALLVVQVYPRESVSYQWMSMDSQPFSRSSSFSGTCSAPPIICVGGLAPQKPVQPLF